MKNKVTLTICLLSLSSMSMAADQCSKSPQESHKEKFERFMIGEVPSLLDSCGLGDLVIDMPSLPSFSADLFCGFGTNDLMGFYGEYSSTSFSKSQSIPSTKNPRKLNTTSDLDGGQQHQSDQQEQPVTSQTDKKWVPADLFKIK